MKETDVKIKEDKIFSVENSINQFVVIDKEDEEEDKENFGFHDLSFKEVYSTHDIFGHVIEHINSYLSKNKSHNDDIVKNIKKISEFIYQNKFTNDILETILLNGIPNSLQCLRPLIWKSFLGYLPTEDLSKWNIIATNNYRHYNSIKKKYPQYPEKITDDKERKIIVQLEKDLPRTRGNISFFGNKTNSKKNLEETNYDVIKRMLFYFAKEHSLSYVQGMNEIIALIYYIFANDDNPFFKKFVESDTYCCFTLLVKEIEPIFRLVDINFSQLFINKQIKQINEILEVIEPDILNYFREIYFSIDSFVMRWIMVLFAQEFKIDLAVNFWDRMFTQQNKMKFLCFISAAIFQLNKDKIIGKELEEIVEWSKEMGNNINKMDMNEIIKTAFEIKGKYKEKFGKK
jgi:hypothetical protein